MALSYELNGNILHVTETLHGGTNTKVNHWYYDIQNWMKSSHGREGDIPDRKMNENDIAWVKKHYLPKVTQPTA